MSLKKELASLVKTEYDELVLRHLEGVAKATKKYKFEKRISDLAYEAALLHDVGKFYIIFTKIYTKEQMEKYRIGLLHSITGAYYLKYMKNNLLKNLKYPESTIKLVACHSVFYTNKKDLVNLGQKSIPMPLPLPRIRKQLYVIRGNKPNETKILEIEGFKKFEKIALYILMLADHSIIEGKEVPIEKRLDQIFGRYKDVISEEGRKSYKMRIEKIKKYISKLENA